MAIILEIKSELFKFFATNEKFVLPDDLEKILPGSDEKNSDCEIVKLALNSFVLGGIVGKYNFSEAAPESKKSVAKKIVEKTGYILEKPLANWDQQINISGELAGYIAVTLNSFKEKDQILVNPLSITSADIESLIILVGQLFKKSADSQKVVNQLDLGSSGLN